MARRRQEVHPCHQVDRQSDEAAPEGDCVSAAAECQAMTEFAAEIMPVEEMKPMAVAHYEEVGHWDLPVDVDWDFYRNSPAVRTFTVREQGKLVGYAVFLVAPDKHLGNRPMAIADAVYVDPQWRGRTTAYRFVRWCEEQLKPEVFAVYHGTKMAAQWSNLLEAQGYSIVDCVYGKRM